MGAQRRHAWIARKQSAIIFRYSPVRIALIYGPEQPFNLFPMPCRFFAERSSLSKHLRQVARLVLQRPIAVELVCLVRKKFLVFGIRNEQKPKQNNKRHLVCFSEISGIQA